MQFFYSLLHRLYSHKIFRRCWILLKSHINCKKKNNDTVFVSMRNFFIYWKWENLDITPTVLQYVLLGVFVLKPRTIWWDTATPLWSELIFKTGTTQNNICNVFKSCMKRQLQSFESYQERELHEIWKNLFMYKGFTVNVFFAKTNKSILEHVKLPCLLCRDKTKFMDISGGSKQL